MSSPTPGRFHDPVWTFGEALGWLILPVRSLFGRIWDSADYTDKAAEWRYCPAPIADRNPLKSLLHMLQRGEVVAIIRGRGALDRLFWGDKIEQDILVAVDGLHAH